MVANLYQINNAPVTYYPMVIPFMTAGLGDVDFANKIFFTIPNDLESTFSTVRVTSSGFRVFKTSMS